MATKVIIEVEDGDVSGVQSTEALSVVVLNRDKADPTSSDYLADALGAAAQRTTFTTEPAPDIADLYDQFVAENDPMNCDCPEDPDTDG